MIEFKECPEFPFGLHKQNFLFESALRKKSESQKTPAKQSHTINEEEAPWLT